MKKILKCIPKRGIPVILFVLMCCILAYTINLRIHASSLGGNLGTHAGTVAGKAIGSFEGMTDGRIKGEKAGKEEAMHAEDTVAEITDRVHKMENLEVLVASVKLSNFHTIGKNKAYAALYLANGNVVFTVNMNQAKIDVNGSVLRMVLPTPKGTLYLDDSTVAKAAEYQTKFFNGSAEDGFDAYLNTMSKMQEASEKTLDNYDVLVESAEEAAKHQMTLLAQATSSQYEQVKISFSDEGGTHD